jgi:hypothetical protein
MLLQEEAKLNNYGYNPIEKSYLIQPPDDRELQNNKKDNQANFLDALNIAYAQLFCDHKTLLNVKSCIKYVSESVISLNYDKLPVNQIRKKHIKLLMNHCRKKRKMSERTWNAYRSYLMMLFEQLDELEIIDHNPAKNPLDKTFLIALIMLDLPELFLLLNAV